MTNAAVVYLEERFQRANSGAIFSNVFGREFWDHYLSVYDHIHIVARSEPTTRSFLPNEEPESVVSSNISFHEAPYYKGPAQFALKFIPLLVFLWKITKLQGSHILRLPGIIGGMALPFLLTRNQLYGVELVGDPSMVFSSGGVGGNLAVVYKYFFSSITKLACRRAAGTSYVTKSVLQRKYPTSPEGLSVSCSCVQLPSDHFLTPRLIERHTTSDSFSIVVVGSLEQRYKGFDVMLKALELLNRSGRNISLRIIGEGRYKNELKDLANELGIERFVDFLGNIERRDVLKIMDQSDLFVMPSRTEGLPRALIEAMARGLPALGSDVGGIPELLPSECIFKSEDFHTLASMIDRLMDDGEQLSLLSARNVSEAKEYELSKMNEKRHALYSHLIQKS